MWKAEYWIYLGLAVLVVFVTVQILRGKKDTEPNYAGKPEFYNPLT